MNPSDIIAKYYEPGSRAHQILVRHGEAVAGRAVAVAKELLNLEIDLEFIREAAMLHDIGIYLTHMPSIECNGKLPYICHGVLGRTILECHGLKRHALVCERHVGVGIDLSDIRKFGLPLPQRDMLPVTIEEEIICYADKFYSKNGVSSGLEKEIPDIEKSIAPYGPDKLIRFREWIRKFEPRHISKSP
ncbi:MAG: HDIG domain-containing metalloprotein [Thermodesulfobacteriota bacterium]